MTNNDVKQTLKSLNKVAKSMSREELKDLFFILLGIKKDEKIAKFLYMPDILKTIKCLIKNFQTEKHVNKEFSPKQLKQIYTIMGDYNVFPVCQICGKPIKINSLMAMNPKHSHKEFTWDHIYPKSLGGTNTLENMQPTHKLCNNRKGDKILDSVSYEITIQLKFNSLNLLFNPKTKHGKKSKILTFANSDRIKS